MGLDDIIEKIAALLIIAIFLGVLVPTLFQLNLLSGSILTIGLVILLIRVLGDGL